MTHVLGVERPVENQANHLFDWSLSGATLRAKSTKLLGSAPLTMLDGLVDGCVKSTLAKLQVLAMGLGQTPVASPGQDLLPAAQRWRKKNRP